MMKVTTVLFNSFEIFVFAFGGVFIFNYVTLLSYSNNNTIARTYTSYHLRIWTHSIKATLQRTVAWEVGLAAKVAL